ncbi:MAG: type I DNA topoisomerase [Spartobacteria bacterium]|nr:type I DNA topoisomerase [Spartobacteria bacterium]
MGKKLVIVESPAKAKTINKILGENYLVRASMGHIRDLPERQLGVDIEKGFEPHYTTIKGKQKVIKELQTAAKEVDSVYLAPDPDREGEAIAWHLMAELQKQIPEDQFFRVTYNEITASAIREAFEHPGRLDMKRVNSQQARRVLDRIVGYKISPLLWRRIRGGSSAGRVQSVALRLVCERENEINAFVKEKFWILGARVRKLVDPRDPFAVRLVKINGEKADVKTPELAEEIEKSLTDREFTVCDIKRREVRKWARPPFITSTLQQAASSAYGYSPARAMSIAQKLYEGGDFGVGLITYMRTDSVSIAKQAQEQAREFISGTYGADYVPEKPNVYKSRSSAQEAHEAIRPTDVTRTPEEMAKHLSGEELKLYTLIWKRFVASQMAPAKIAQLSVDVDAPAPDPNGLSCLFRVSSSQVLFPGYMKVTGAENKKQNGNGKDSNEDEGEDAESLPPLEIGEKIECLEALKEEKETQPPPRYTEASLVRALEENGVGRPSTYASIISTLKSRKYVEKEKRALKPTEVGANVNEFLITNLNELFDVKFTADMEQSLDEIENGTVEWTGMLATFYTSFQEWIEKAKGPAADKNVMARMLDTVNQVAEWGPEQKRGKRTYSDKKFVESLRKQFEEGKKAVSQRQLDALIKLGAKYREQIPDWDQVVAELDIKDAVDSVLKAVEPPREETIAKLDALKEITFEEPRTVGERTFDDAVFCSSLRDQVENGKRLSSRQIKYLDRLLNKYADQLGGVEAVSKKFDFAPDVVVEDTESGPLLELMAHVQQWRDPVKRGKRTWDDHEFYDSLKKQFEGKGALSPRQVAALKKMIPRYAEQIPDFARVADQYELKLPKAPKKKSAKTDVAPVEE